ncbi:hypothetical protein PV04_09033 [Phialophora macrospora]|uniref:Carboxylic ester hydrolase n=1 Tax=Phialophora macrospora TaxID=1851006 RepID=A0A0D2FB64_9EURO|nr:hypothetical protein PV04_09033 [Phialophora macrospora]
MATVTLDNNLEDLRYSADNVQLRGFLSTHHVANFLNIPYATASVRFRPATPLRLYDLPAPYDATQYGPRCPQPEGTLHLTMSHLFEQMSLVHQLAEETTCLNLNIYAPPSSLSPGPSSKLPVLVWIHGGAFNVGDNTVQFDGNHLVKKSVEVGQPVIVVAINYRLNLFGSVSSRELADEAKGLGEAHVPNQGLDDQRIALQWVQSYIHHFGGDPGKVTLCGESAGAYSVIYHLKGNIPLFQQAMMQSPPLMPLRTTEEAQAAFDKLVASAGISVDASSAEKLAALRALSTQELIDLFDGSFSSPIEDPNWFVGYDRDTVHPSTFWADLPSWCPRIILGTTQDETALMLAPIEDLKTDQAVAFLQMLVSQNPAQASLMARTRSKRETITWSTDQMFLNPLKSLVSAAVTKSPNIGLYTYRIHCPDPFPGPLQGYAWHSYGIPFTFNQPACRKYPELARMQDNMTPAFLRFLSGYEPWESFNTTRKMMCWTSRGAEMVNAEHPPVADEQAQEATVVAKRTETVGA